mmetsp:Transcript_8960/g.14938  ORF Transcript_8960/g.14938 Transcript_8960/m.14938 type:complete len:236 (-) Transcript_8960:485-1192(-)|eukprot:CAMPEP_0119007548 /NCGR_PEP_ID=MMETSP1176-20130426/3082_1 /TAXON_ID=265551 /ORGANISM="Synedropsis recta cf, Strain CCMP1620" /LENGTH=235 /DNA_ID=CAMNT_0006959719 /DNA_START=402 /DNA_END=1109 /DNA_ORIENTATION=+
MKHIFLFLLAVISALATADICGFCDEGQMIRPREGEQYQDIGGGLGCDTLEQHIASEYQYNNTGDNCDAIKAFFQGAVDVCGCTNHTFPEVKEALPLCGFCENSEINTAPSFELGTSHLHCHDLPGFLASMYNGDNCPSIRVFFQGAVDACGCTGDIQLPPQAKESLFLCGFCENSTINVGQTFPLGTSSLHCHDLSGFMAAAYDGSNCHAIRTFFEGAVDECGCMPVRRNLRHH